VVAFSLAASSAGANGGTPTSVLERSMSCGPNAIYMFLILCDVNPTEASVRSIVYGAEGASFGDLIKCAEACGVDTEVRKYAPGDFQRMRLPAICQTSGGREGGRIKHFYVAYDVDSTGIWTLDGTTGKRSRIRKERIADYLSGYALVRKSSFLSVISGYGVWFTLTLLAANLVLLNDLWRKRSSVAAFASDRDDTSAESEL
jgi:ABC-type bacteriocin/lantibiotic exporter with double-glycine peptidase domain